MRRSRSALLVVGLLVAGVSGGVAYARVSANPTSNVIYACVNKLVGVPRIVSGPGQCKKFETLLSWNRQGEAGPPGTTTTAAWFRSVPLNSQIAVPVTLPPNGSAPAEVNVVLPAAPPGGGYLMNVTFGLRNTGPVDAEVVCNVGNIMGHQFFAPVSDQTAGQENLGGVYGSDTRTYTITGAYTSGGSVGLRCGINNWTAQGTHPDPTQAPSVWIVGVLLSAERIDQLTDQS